jgi:glucosamine--fructose-6-phosphate aminotransferase (isomerizing)
MEKEIYEQPDAVANTINGKLGEDDVLDNIFGLGSSEIFTKIKRIQFVACGTSLHAGKVGRFWFEQIAKIPCYVDFASEYRYRDPLVEEGTLFVTISQSGETADTLAALRYAQEKDYLSTLSICNVATSSLARESEHVLFTNAGPRNWCCIHQGIHHSACRPNVASHVNCKKLRQRPGAKKKTLHQN